MIFTRWAQQCTDYRYAGCSGRKAVIRRRYSVSRKKSDWNELCRIVDIPDEVSSMKRNLMRSS